MTTFSHNLKQKRLELKWSQERVAMEISVAHAKRTGRSYHISPKTCYSWEQGRTAPKLDVLVTIVEVFQVDDLYLFISKSY